MVNSVNLKGTSSGMILELDPEISFDELKNDIANKFKENKNFLGSSMMGLLIKGRVVDDSEEEEILKLISDNCNIRISCVLKEDPILDKTFLSYIKSVENTEENSNKDSNIESKVDDDSEVSSEVADLLPGSAFIYSGNLRSGQSISDRRSVVVMGDVKPGATVKSDGSIFVLGALRGSAFAGASGDEKSFVFALDLDPLQVRISNAIAISPDSEKGPKLKVRRFRKKPDEKTSEVAYILDGHVVKDSYGLSFLRNHLGAK